MVLHEQHWCGVSVLHIRGPLHVPVGAELRGGVQALLDRGGRRILLDLSRVPAIDAGGLGELVHLYNMAAATGAMLRIVKAPAQVRALLDRARLFDLLSGDGRPAAPRLADRVA